MAYSYTVERSTVTFEHGDVPGAHLRSKPVAFFLWSLWLVGACGMHRFYLGKWFSGLLYLLTFGFLFIGQLLDIFFLSNMVDVRNAITIGRSVQRHSHRRSARGRATPPPLPSVKRDRMRRPCPECAEPIRVDARTCRFCGADLTAPREYDDPITFCDCPACGDLLEVPTHLVGVPGKCAHCGQEIEPHPPGQRFTA